MSTPGIQLEPDDTGTLPATSPDIPAVTFGDDRASALRHASDTIEMLLASLMIVGQKLPLPDHGDVVPGDVVPLPLQTEFEPRLYQAVPDTGPPRADLQRGLPWSRETIVRIFRLDRNFRLEPAFPALGKTIDPRVHAAL